MQSNWKKNLFAVLLFLALVLPVLVVVDNLSAASVAPEGVKDVFHDIGENVENAEILPGFKQTFSRDDSLRDYLVDISKKVRSFFSGIVAFLIVLAGIRLIVSGGEDNVIKEQRRNILWLVVGLVVMYTAETFVAILFQEKGYSLVSSGVEGVAQGVRESLIGPFLRLGEALLAGVAVFSIVAHGLQMITALGDDAKIKENQKGVFYGLLGLVVVLIARPLVENIFGYAREAPNIGRALEVGFSLTNYLLSYVSVLAVVLLIAAGLMMILHLGSEETLTKARKTVIFVILGLALLLSVYTIVTIFISPTTV